MSFDQTAERTVVEAEMLDTCLITRDHERETDDVLNETTLELEPGGTGYDPLTVYDEVVAYAYEDATTIYAGKCSVALYSGIGSEDRNEGEREDTRQMWRSSVPISAALPKYGDTFKVTAVRVDGDPLLLDKEFTIVRVGGHTQGVRRPLVLQDALGETVR